jgi:hypothetical protein
MKRTAGLYFAWLVAVVMLGFAVTGKHPYSFYVLLRWICCAVFAISAFTAHKQYRDLWVWVFGVLALLFNPIVPLHLQRDTWQGVDWSAIGVVVIAAISFWRDKGTERDSKNMNEEKLARTFGRRHGNGESLRRSGLRASENGDSNKLPEKHSSNPSRLRRTLWGAAIGALLAMLFVPCIRDGYEPIFNAAKYRINVAQLVLNVSFAALVGALASNFSGRAWRALSWIAASVALALTAWIAFSTFQQQMKTKAEREESAAWGAILNGNFDVAKEHLLKASNYWWWRGWWDGARSARERAFDDQGMKRKLDAQIQAEKSKLDAQIQAERMEAEKAAVFRAQTDEVRARQLLRGESWNNYHPSDENVTEAKQFLLDAAEAWHIAGNSAEEQRVRAWETNIKTETELSVIEGKACPGANRLPARQVDDRHWSSFRKGHVF